MRPYHHADDLNPEQRFQRIVALLATGLRRLRPRRALAADPTEQAPSKNPPKLSPDCLAFHGETRLSGHAG
jgi:hypothetical protein